MFTPLWLRISLTIEPLKVLKSKPQLFLKVPLIAVTKPF